MPTIFIHAANIFWLVLMFVGVPAATALQLGRVQLSATPEFQMLTLGGFGLSVALNFLGGTLARGKSARIWWKWLFVHAGWLAIYYLVFAGHIHFRWLKDTLLWLKKTFT